MPCLDEETILAFCRGTLQPSARARAEEHLAACDDCRTVLSVLARSSVAGDLPTGSPLGSPTDVPVPVAARGHVVTPLGLGPEHGGADPMAPTTPLDRERRPSSTPPASPLQPGSVVAGKYDVERVLGAGGMGIVVAARHRQLGQRVALKFLQPSACEVPGAVDRFLREGQAAARITSEHVARVLDTGVLDRGAPYLVLEYLDGRDLGAVVQARGKLEPGEAIEYVLQACEAVAEAHALGIVHRDLKPANLFLSRRADGSPLVKVLDFGISKIEESGSRPALTSTSALMGSPRYMSPEQMLSAKDVDPRADVWALGVLLFELVAGRPVWTADTVQGLCALIATAPAPNLRDFAPDAPRELASLVADCLAKSRDERIPSVADLALRLLPIAPPRAHTSIERIVRVSGRTLPGAPERAPAASNALPKRQMVLAFTAAVVVGILGAYAVHAFDAHDAVSEDESTTSPRPVATTDPHDTPPSTLAAPATSLDAPNTALPASLAALPSEIAVISPDTAAASAAVDAAASPASSTLGHPPSPPPASTGTTKRATTPSRHASPAHLSPRAPVPPTNASPPSSATNRALSDRK